MGLTSFGFSINCQVMDAEWTRDKMSRILYLDNFDSKVCKGLEDTNKRNE